MTMPRGEGLWAYGLPSIPTFRVIGMRSANRIHCDDVHRE
jgi:hypothetical protein